VYLNQWTSHVNNHAVETFQQPSHQPRQRRQSAVNFGGPIRGQVLKFPRRSKDRVPGGHPYFTARGSVRGDWKWYGSTSNTEGTEIFLPIPGHITCKILVRLPHSPEYINQSVYSVHWILATLRILISKNVKCQIKFEERIDNNNISKVSSKMSSGDNVSPGHGDNNCRRVDNCRRCRTIKLIIVASASVLWTSHDALNALMIRKSADLRSRNYVGDILRRITILRYLQLQKKPLKSISTFLALKFYGEGGPIILQAKFYAHTRTHQLENVRVIPTQALQWLYFYKPKHAIVTIFRLTTSSCCITRDEVANRGVAQPSWVPDTCSARLSPPFWQCGPSLSDIDTAATPLWRHGSELSCCCHKLVSCQNDSSYDYAVFIGG